MSAGDLAFEVAGAVLSHAEKSGDLTLAGQVSYSRRAITAGSGNAVSARIQGIIDVAAEELASLGDHGVMQAKVNSLKQRLKTYDQLRVLPRQAKAAARPRAACWRLGLRGRAVPAPQGIPAGGKTAAVRGMKSAHCKKEVASRRQF